MVLGGKEKEEVEEEIPLEIEDYSCNTIFEEIVGEIERYLVEEFRTRPELQRFLLNSEKNNEKEKTNIISNRGIVLGRNFPINRHGKHIRKGNTSEEEEGIAVEIHLCDMHQQKQHPISRMFTLPIFFLARRITLSSSYLPSESSFYLSLLTTAVSRVMRGVFSLSLGSDFSIISSPFFYPNGTAPCFVAIGDHYQLAFVGVAPPVMLGEGVRNPIEQWSLHRLISQPVIKYRFQCTAYPHPPEWCRHVSDYLDMFQLQIGPQSRICTDVFDGICVSLQQKFTLKIPRKFVVNYSENRLFYHTNKHEENSLTWHNILEIENETMLLSAGPTTFPFGTGTAPLRGIHFFFQWNKLHDTEANDDGKRNSNLNPFLAEGGSRLKKKITIKALADPKMECELNHEGCKNISEYVYMIMEFISSEEKIVIPQKFPENLSILADEIVYSHTISITGQKILINRLIKHQLNNESSTNLDIRNIYFPGSLLCRFAYICANRIEFVKDIYILWLLIVERLAKLLEGGVEGQNSLQQLIETIGIPPVEEIDHGLPLLVQKFQLLSYCAKRMLDQTQNKNKKNLANGWEEDIEELPLYETGEISTPNKIIENGITSSIKRLITNGEPLIEPHILPTPPCTSDILLMKAQELQNLGTASAGQNTRAWMQSEGLFNDMCLFLYVNKAHEGRIVRFPDFVQWHSPRDFIQPNINNKENKNDDNSDDDDLYLSERMRRYSGHGSANLWWPLWNQAKPRSPEEIISQSFIPHEQARLIIRWMEKDLNPINLLLETINANFSNSLHRMLSHRCIESNHNIGFYALKRSETIASSIRVLTQLEDFVIDEENVRSTYSIAIRQIGEIETSLCVALSIERVLGFFHESNIDTPLENEICESEGQFVAALSSPKEGEKENSAGIILREAILNWDLWYTSGIFKRFKDEEQKPVAMFLRATCMAERPLNTTPCFQQMIAETDETGVFRVALALAEEVF